MAPKTRSQGADSDSQLTPPATPARSRDTRSSSPLARLSKANGKRAAAARGSASGDVQLVMLLTILAVGVRLFRISKPTSVVFDEVHFGGFASKYINHKFFMDVHPPLAKLMITAVAWLAGFDGSFLFKEIGLEYAGTGAPYVAMRLLPGILGVLVVPIAFMTLRALGCGRIASITGAVLVTFDNALITQSRFILLDSPLIAFTAFTAFAFAKFNMSSQKPFSASWWLWLLLTGIGLGATVSVKWIGLFTIGWVGTLTVFQLWFMLADLSITPRQYVRHFVARAVALIFIPAMIYLMMFQIHFMILTHSGEGDGFMSSEFQATLQGKETEPVAADVSFNSRVTIRHVNSPGGVLHSHPHMYETGSKQQQITLYPHKDPNNIWKLENQTDSEISLDEQPPVFIENGAVVRLYHTQTNKRLHSHDHKAPVSDQDWQQEVSAYGYEGFAGDANDFFRIEILPHMSRGVGKERLRTLESRFRLIHVMSGCVLFSPHVKLPEWGFGQQEVTCAKSGTLPNSVWMIEENTHPMLAEDAEKVNYVPLGFFEKVWELQKVMWKTNSALVDTHNWDSRPESWPILRRGINFWAKDHTQVYLIGNPVIWWSSCVAIALYLVLKGLLTLRWQRGYGDFANPAVRHYDWAIGTAVAGWAFHYLPFFLMQRQLFLHHYLPALYFAIMTFAQTWDLFCVKVLKSKGKSASVTLLFLLAVVVSYQLLTPLSYGGKWTRGECERSRLLKKWDFDCNSFPLEYAEYDHFVASQPAGIPSTSPVSVQHEAEHEPQPIGGIDQARDKQADSTIRGAPSDGQDTPVVSERAVEGDQVRESESAPKASDPVEGITENAALPPGISAAPQYAPLGGASDVSEKYSTSVLKREEKVEYRDQDGNLLSPDEVEELRGKVSFRTLYETKTRLVDAEGNPLSAPPEGFDMDGHRLY